MVFVDFTTALERCSGAECLRRSNDECLRLCPLLPGGDDGAPASCAPRLTPDPTLALALAALDDGPATGFVTPSEARLALAQCGVALTAAETLVLGEDRRESSNRLILQPFNRPTVQPCRLFLSLDYPAAFFLSLHVVTPIEATTRPTNTSR